jgi:hypothetical protein
MFAATKAVCDGGAVRVSVVDMSFTPEGCVEMVTP